MSEDLKTRLEECQVGIASRGQQQPDGTYLAPHLWEQLRQRLQGIYRRATGEADAVLSVEQTAPAEHVVGGEVTLREAAQALLDARENGLAHIGYRLDLWDALKAVLESEQE